MQRLNVHRACAALVVALLTAAAAGAASDENVYHWNGQPQFFEGWYFKVSDPATQNSFFFICAVFNPDGMSPDSTAFMMVGSNSPGKKGLIYREYPVETFSSRYDVFETRIGDALFAGGDTETLHIEGETSDADNACAWNIDMDITERWQNTMGWMGLLPDLQTYWHVGALRARASGYIEWNGERFEFEDIIGYQEKNWGVEFPESWFWLQANNFDDPDACCLSIGGATMPLGPVVVRATGIGFQYQGRLYTFSYPQQPALVQTSIEPGTWRVQARKGRHRIIIDGACDPDDLLTLLNPTVDGIKPWTWESINGAIRVRLYEKRGFLWRERVDTTSDLAACEFGGQEWVGWDVQQEKHRSSVKQH